MPDKGGGNLYTQKYIITMDGGQRKDVGKEVCCCCMGRNTQEETRRWIEGAALWIMEGGYHHVLASYCDCPPVSVCLYLYVLYKRLDM